MDILTLVQSWSNSRWTIVYLSGRDGQTLFAHHSFDVFSLGQYAPYRYRPAGDFDQDGVPDWCWQLCLSGSYDLVEVRSGRTGGILLKDRLWSAYSLLGDIDTDGDGRPNLVVADPANNRVLVYDSVGDVILRIVAPPGFVYARDLAKVGDTDGDGCDDFVMACPEPSTGGAAVLVSGRTGTVLHVGYGRQLGDNLDYKVIGTGDIDGDGVPDFAAGSFSGGVVRVFSGRTGAALHTWVRPGEGLFGIDIAGGFDVDRDGVPDLVVQSPSGPNFTTIAVIYALSGRDGRELYRFRPSVYGQLGYGAWMTLLPAAPGSPFPLLLVTDWSESRGSSSQGNEGSMRLYRMMPEGAVHLGDACPGGNPGLQLGVAPQSPALARGRITLFGAPPAAACALILGGPAQLDLGWLGYPGCLQRTTATWAIPMIVPSSGPERGLAAIELPVPFGMRGRVASFDIQGIGLVGGGLRFSDGIRLRVLLP